MAAFFIVRSYTAVACLAIAAQAGPRQLSGSVSDPQSLAVPGARVTLRCLGGRDSTKSNGSGQFVFKSLPSGECSLIVIHPGFAQFKQTLDPSMRDIPVHLELAVAKHSVDVTADVEAPALLERTINSVSLSDEQLKAVSNNTEDWIRYAKLQAGVTSGSDAIYVDGLPATSLPPSAAVARVTVNADPFSVQYSDGDMTHIDIVTKGGDRTFGLSFGGLSFGAGGHNVLAPGLRSTSRSGQGDFKGYIPRIPVTFTVHLNGGSKNDEQPILAVFPPASFGTTPNPLKASVGSSSLSGSVDVFYTGENFRSHVSASDSRTTGSNLGAGGLTLPEAGVSSRSNSYEVRATVNKEGAGFLYSGGIVAAERHSATDANSILAGLTVPGAFVDGGSPITNSDSSSTHWTLNNVFQSSSAPASWTSGLTISGENDSKRTVPNAAGSFTFPDLQAYAEALAGEGTGTWVLIHGNGAASYSGVSAAPFFQKTILHSKHLLFTGGLRVDYQSGLRLLASPRLSGAAEYHGFVFRLGGGLFARDISGNVFLRVIGGDTAHLEQTIVTNVSLEDPPLVGTLGADASSGGLIHTRLAADLTRPRELMQKASVERRFGKFSAGTEYTWTHGRHLLGSRRLPDEDGWTDVLASDRSSDRQRVHSQIRYRWRGQSLAAHYEWIRSYDDTSGPFSFPAEQNDVREEWARSAGVAPHNVTLVGKMKLPGDLSLIVTDTWRGSAPYNITTGLDPANDGLYTDRGGLARNSGNGPAYNSLSLYGYKRIPVPKVAVKGKRVFVDFGVRVENLLGNKDYTSVGSVVGSPTFRQPLTALPGRAVRVWLNLD